MVCDFPRTNFLLTYGLLIKLGWRCKRCLSENRTVSLKISPNFGYTLSLIRDLSECLTRKSSTYLQKSYFEAQLGDTGPLISMEQPRLFRGAPPFPQSVNNTKIDTIAPRESAINNEGPLRARGRLCLFFTIASTFLHLPFCSHRLFYFCLLDPLSPSIHQLPHSKHSQRDHVLNVLLRQGLGGFRYLHKDRP